MECGLVYHWIVMESSQHGIFKMKILLALLQILMLTEIIFAKNLDDFGELTMQSILRFPGVNTITSSLSLKVIKEPEGYPL